MKKLSSSTFIYRKTLIESGEMGTVVFCVERYVPTALPLFPDTPSQRYLYQKVVTTSLKNENGLVIMLRKFSRTLREVT